MLEETRRFKAIADDGTEYTIVEYATTREVRTSHGAQKVQNRLRELLTVEGYHVNPVAEGVFEVIIGSDAIEVRIVDGTEGSSAQ